MHIGKRMWRRENAIYKQRDNGGYQLSKEVVLEKDLPYSNQEGQPCHTLISDF